MLGDFGLISGGFALATCHRAENTDDPKRLSEIVSALAEVSRQMPVVLPLHPRTRKLIADNGLEDKLGSVIVAEPIPFLDMVALEQAARVILTDSGGVQKEAFFYGVPCVTMRDETEWVETLESVSYTHLDVYKRQLQERSWWIRQAPKLAGPLELLIPIYRNGERARWLVGAGIRLYDLLATGSGFPRGRWYSADEVAERFPGLKRDQLLGAYGYWDARMDDLSLIHI